MTHSTKPPTIVLRVAGVFVEAKVCPICPGKMALYPRETFDKHMERHDSAIKSGADPSSGGVGINHRNYKWTQPGWMLAQWRRAKKARAQI